MINRRSGVGGSEAAAVCGLSRWSNPTKIWLAKTGRIPDFGGNLATRAGKWLEPFIAQEYSNATGKRLKQGRLLRHPKHKYMLGTPDFLVADEAIGVEIKFTGRLSEDYGPEGTDLVPIEHLFQVQQYMEVCALPEWHIAVMESTRQFRIYRIQRDHEFIGLMAEDEERFFVDHVLPDVPPIDSTSALDTYVKAMYPTQAEDVMVQADDEAVVWSNNLRLVKAEMKILQEKLEFTENSLKYRIQGASGIIGDGFLHTWKQSKPSKMVDWQALALSLGATPKEIAQFTLETPGSRRFVPHWDNAKE